MIIYRRTKMDLLTQFHAYVKSEYIEDIAEITYYEMTPGGYFYKIFNNPLKEYRNIILHIATYDNDTIRTKLGTLNRKQADLVDFIIEFSATSLEEFKTKFEQAIYYPFGHIIEKKLNKEIISLRKSISVLQTELDCIPGRGSLYQQAKDHFEGLHKR